MKNIIFCFALISFVIFHIYRVNKTEQKTALEIMDSLRVMELEVVPDEILNGDNIYFSPRKYARRIAIMDCEQLIYEKYKLWQ